MLPIRLILLAMFDRHAGSTVIEGVRWLFVPHLRFFSHRMWRRFRNIL